MCRMHQSDEVHAYANDAWEKYRAIMPYTTHHLDNTHSVIWVATEHLHHGYHEDQGTPVEAPIAVEGGHLTSRPRVQRGLDGFARLSVAGPLVIRAESHDLRIPWVRRVASFFSARVHHDCDLCVVHGLQSLVEKGVLELASGGLAHNEKAESQA